MKFRIFLKKHPEVRKIFGKQEINIMNKQLLGIRLSQSEKNRLSRDIRPKLKVINELSNFKEHFDLKKGLENKQIIRHALNVILDDEVANKIKEIWLAGSIISGKMNIRSDIDMVVLFKQINKNQAFLFRKRIAGRVDDRVDIQVFNILPDKIRKSILNNHKVLYKNE
ncbi:MAG: nucleotidyltransferase domain-containing protein [Candidatus Nanoarchaeia archaeon]